MITILELAAANFSVQLLSRYLQRRIKRCKCVISRWICTRTPHPMDAQKSMSLPSKKKLTQAIAEGIYCYGYI